MKRLHELSFSQIEDWFLERDSFGTKKYGDMHLNRYGLVDVVEELSDALHILKLYRDRCEKSGLQIAQNQEYKHAFTALLVAVDAMQDLDRITPEAVCTDENGGERIWWPDEKGIHHPPVPGTR